MKARITNFTVTLTQGPGLGTKINRLIQRKKAAVIEATQESADRALFGVLGIVPRLTHYMANHTDVRFPTLTTYRVGWWREDFVGEVNPVTKRVITTFYPRYVIGGSRGKAGNDVLAAALQAERPLYREGIARAMKSG